MPKGVTNAVRFILTRRELEALTNGGRRFTSARVTDNTLHAVALLNEDLRTMALNELVVVEVTHGNAA